MFGIFKKKTEQAVERSRQSWFGRVARLFERPIAEETWEELENLLISADVGVETTQKLLGRVRKVVKDKGVKEPSQVQQILKEEMVNLLQPGPQRANGQALRRCSGQAQDSGPRVVLVVGVNGSGKTTSIAKLAYSYSQEGKKVILAAADTFRAAAIDQLRVWGERVGAEVIAHQPGGDPGAVAFDALQAAKSRQAQVLIVDTAGRLHTKVNLMEELKKISRVVSKVDSTAPHEVLLVLDATTGQNGLLQAGNFTDAVGVSGIILAKLDGTAKGGVILAIYDQLKIPVAYIGTGEGLDDLVPFDARTFVEAVLS